MKIREIFGGVDAYVAWVRAKSGDSLLVTKTLVFADSFNGAKLMLLSMYGKNSVISLSKL